MLAELLSQNSNGTFLIPGTHGIIFPWTPPLFGIGDIAKVGAEID